MPERWLGPDAKTCEAALSAFSKGPRSCFGVNLAYAEIHMGIANIFRRFELRVDETRCEFFFFFCLFDMLSRPVCFALARPASLKVKEHFMPLFTEEHLHAYCKPAKD